MLSIFKSTIIINQLVPQNKQFINQLIKNNNKFDFTNIFIVDSCPKTSSTLVNKNIFPNIETIYLFSKNFGKKEFNNLLFNQNNKINLHIEFGKGAYLYKNESLYEQNYESIFFLTKDKSNKLRFDLNKKYYQNINYLQKYETNAHIKKQIEYYNDWIGKY